MGPEIIRKVKVMFRKMAIALVAASVFTVPVLAQNDTLSGGSSNKSSQATSPPAGESAEKPEKAEKSAEAVEKSTKKITHHRKVARHHRRGTKAAKYAKSRSTAVYAKHPSSEMVKSEKRYVGQGRTTSKRAYGRVSKPIRSKTMTKPGLD